MEPWNRFLSELEEKLGEATVNKWLRPLLVLRFDAANLYLSAQNTFQIDWFEEHIRPYLTGKFFNNNQRPIQVHLSLPNQPYFKNTKQPDKKKIEPSFFIAPDSLDPEMILENFIPSDQNKMAFEIISEAERSPFNPIFLYGPKNSGKSHLLMSAVRILQEKRKNVFFVRANSFTEHVVQAIRLGFMQQFREIYRRVDALVIDDIHIFSRKNATQEEFFHTFNALQTNLQTIILSANKAPSLLEEIEPRLISRFEWGITIGLNTIDPKLILKKKASLWNIALSAEMIEYLVEKFPFAPLVALQALALRTQKSSLLTPKLAEPILKDLLAKEEENSWTADRIIKKTAGHYGIKIEDLRGKSQTKESAYPRQLAMYLCREKLKLPYQKIGEAFGRDHSTVMASVKQIQKAIDENDQSLIRSISSIYSQ